MSAAMSTASVQVSATPILLGIFSMSLDSRGYSSLTHSSPSSPHSSPCSRLMRPCRLRTVPSYCQETEPNTISWNQEQANSAALPSTALPKKTQRSRFLISQWSPTDSTRAPKP